MVLSNKKLKQNLRAAVAESLTESVAETHPSNNDSTNPDPNPKPQSLKELLDSATQKPRLSKREKRRKTLSLQDSEAVNRSNNDNNLEENKEGDTEGMNNNDNDNDKEKKKKKKRKRDGDEVIENVKTANKKKKKKKKKAAAKNMEEKKGVELGNGENGEQVIAETVKVTDSQENGDVATKVYVGGIPYYSSEDDIRSYFESCGTITEIDCMKFPESGKFRGIAIISFKTEAAAKRALAFDGADMGGLFLKIQTYKTTRANKVSDFAPEIVEGYNRIYAGNLSWDITEDDLRNFFTDCSISSIRFGMDKETGEFRGYAHVDFSDSLSLTMALKLDQEIVCGRPVKISCAVPKKGAKTHSKSPINNKKSDSAGVVPEKEAETHSRSPPSKKTDSTGVSSGTGKKKRRTCYECGEPGHISSACPKKQAADPTNSSAS